MGSAVKIQPSGSGHNGMEMAQKTKLVQPQLQSRSSAWGRMLLTGTLILGLAAGVSAAGKKDKAAQPKEETRIAQVSQSQIPARNVSTIDTPKPKKNPSLVSASRWITINGRPYKLVLQTRDDWDYVNTGVETNGTVQFVKFELGEFNDESTHIEKLANRALTIGNSGWIMTGENGTYRHLIVNGFSGEVAGCTIISGITSRWLNNCGITYEIRANNNRFDWIFLEGEKQIGYSRFDLSCKQLATERIVSSHCVESQKTQP